MFKPPKCPCCGYPLNIVYENVYETWFFDEKTGTYKENTDSCDIEIRCPNCHCKLYDVFPEGVCNFSLSEKKNYKQKSESSKKEDSKTTGNS